MAEAVFRHPTERLSAVSPPLACRVSRSIAGDMGADIEDHPIRVTQLPGIQLPGGKIECDRLTSAVKAAWLLQITFDPDDILR